MRGRARCTSSPSSGTTAIQVQGWTSWYEVAEPRLQHRLSRAEAHPSWIWADATAINRLTGCPLANEESH